RRIGRAPSAGLHAQGHAGRGLTGRARPGRREEPDVVGAAAAALYDDIIDLYRRSVSGLEGRTPVVLVETEPTVLERDVPDVPQPPAVGGPGAVVARRVRGRLFRRVDVRVGGGVAAGDGQVDVGERHVGDRVAGQPGDGAGERTVVAQAGAGHVVQGDPADGADAGVSGAAATRADLEEDRSRGMGHGDVAVADVGDVRAVHRHDADAGFARALDGDVREVRVAEVAAGLRAELERVVAGR